MWNLGSAGIGGSVIPRSKGMVKGYLPPSGHAKLSNFLCHQAVGDDKTICSKRLPFMVRFISDAFEFVNEANQAAAANVRNHFLGVRSFFKS